MLMFLITDKKRIVDRTRSDQMFSNYMTSTKSLAQILLHDIGFYNVVAIQKDHFQIITLIGLHPSPNPNPSCPERNIC